jgi:hypothetical protein
VAFIYLQHAWHTHPRQAFPWKVLGGTITCHLLKAGGQLWWLSVQMLGTDGSTKATLVAVWLWANCYISLISSSISNVRIILVFNAA